MRLRAKRDRLSSPRTEELAWRIEGAAYRLTRPISRRAPDRSSKRSKRTLTRTASRARKDRQPKASMARVVRSVKKREARAGDRLDRPHRKRQSLIRNDLVGFFAEAFLQAPPPRNPQFGVDMDDVDSGANRLAQVFIIGSRSAVEGQRCLNSALDLSDSLDLQSLSCLTLHHALQHPVHVADRRSEDVYPCRLHEFFRLRRRGQPLRQVGCGFMDFRSGPDVADLALDEDLRIDSLKSYDGLFRLAHVLLER